MNNILIVNNKLECYEDDTIKIDSNKISFKKTGDYSIYYEECSNFNLEIELFDNVFIKLFEYMSDMDINNNITYNLNDNADLLVFKFYSNREVNENVNINLNGYMSKISYNFSNICTYREKYNIVINHNNSNSISNISNKSICLDGGSICFNIDTTLSKGNIRCNLSQDTKIVNFGDNNSIIRPNMYISEDDVEARHASVIGNFNEEELFYLMSRGIRYNDAIKLLVKGYIFSNLIVDMDKRSRILNVINKYWR